MKLVNATRVFVLERQVGMMIKLLAFFEARPDIEVVEANQNVRGFMDEAARLELRALMDELRPDAVIVDLRQPFQNDLYWLSKVREITYAPLIAFTACDMPSKRVCGIRFFETVRRPAQDDDETLQMAFRMLAFAIRRARLQDDRPPPIADMALVPGCGDTELIAIGASAGGTEAIPDILSGLPPGMPPILVVQHITKGFAEVFARHLDRCSRLKAAVACEGEFAQPGCVYVAPDRQHLTVEKHWGRYMLHCNAGARISGHLPSVNALFGSVAQEAGAKAVGVLLTGMGRDGAEGLMQMHSAGALTIAQDEQSSLIYGMPKAAYELGAVSRRLPLERIGDALIDHIRKGDA